MTELEDTTNEVEVLTKKQQLKKQIVDLQASVDDLAQKLEAEKKNASYANTRASKAEAEIEQMHAIFDSLSIPRKSKDDSVGYCSETTLTISARLVQFIAKLIPAIK